MKLRNKKDGEIVEIRKGEEIIIPVKDNNDEWYELTYTSITELNSDWEDYEEPETFWYIRCSGEVYEDESDASTEHEEKHKQIGNYFETKEEAEKAVEKLKAWKRLKDKGFRFTLTPGVGSLDITPGKFQIEINAEMPAKWFCCDVVQEDLDLLFGGEE